MITTKHNMHSALYFIFKSSEVLVSKTEKNAFAAAQTALMCLDENYAKDWFTDTDSLYTAILLDDGAPTPAGYRWVRLRTLFAENATHIKECARALALLHWRQRTRFCGVCGCILQDDKYEVARTCIQCGEIVFPRISPAIIILVHKGDKILLARHVQRNTNVYTCLAGYMECGETIEQCAEREVYEETALKITNIRYCASQAWPYPDQLMIALHADWESGDIVVQQDEIDDARWFSTDSLPETPQSGTVAYSLIHGEI